MIRTEKDYDNVILLNENKHTIRGISKITGISRGTVSKWLKQKPKYLNDIFDNIVNNLKDEYSYLLGIYLGDGYINKTEKTYRLRISLDKKYTNINENVIKILNKIFPNNKVGIIDREGCIDISVYNNNLPKLFPQHGIGRKHNRLIQLTGWKKVL